MRHEHIPPHLRDEPTHMELFEEMKKINDKLRRIEERISP